MILTVILGALALLSTGLVLWQFVLAMQFPLHRRISNPHFAPDISLLKPLKGADLETRACLESWITQRYGGRVQILFGVASPDDPACEIVRELLHSHAAVDAELVICAENLGANAKVSTLIQLQRRARYELIAVSDADVLVPEDFLAQAVAPLENGRIGLVNCFYRLPASARFGMRCEAFMVNCDFWSQVLQARALKPMDFSLGAVMITTRTWLDRAGAFASLVDYLADDYHLGNRIANARGEIALSSVVVDCRSAPMTATEVWHHQLRWARTIRVSQPAPYFFSILNDVTLWALLWAIVQPRALEIVNLFLATRALTALFIERKLTGRLDFSTLPVALVCDLARPFVWAASFLNNSVVWRGRKYRVLKTGKLVPLDPESR